MRNFFKNIFSRTSPKGGRRACLCRNNTYSIKCCNGSLHAQGIGNTSSVTGEFSKEFNNDFNI
jgi:hypothetical protein